MEDPFLLSLLAGLMAGATHVIAGPDHWIAVAPLSMDQPKRAARIGLRWGLGHGVGILILGAIGLTLREFVSISAISSIAEAMVGVVLVISGAWALHRSKALIIHRHPHNHDHENAHEHEHVHLHVGELDHDDSKAHLGHTHAAFGLGALHGVAGASQLLALIPTLALPTHAAITYLCSFLIASVLTMVCFAHLVGRVSQRGGDFSLHRTFAVVGWGSVIFGVYWTGAAVLTT